MTEQSHDGACHCGAVRFTAEVDLDQTVTCNCSRCQRLGAVLAFAPTEKFELKSGEAELTEYRFNKKVIAHQFCKICGIQTFAYGQMPDGTPMVAVTVNCLEGVDPRSLTSHHHDGRNQ